MKVLMIYLVRIIMNIQTNILDTFESTSSKILAVTKYLDISETNEVIDFMEQNYIDILEWFWENRVESLKEKNLPREKVHFIGNIQSKQIKDIISHCEVVHSLDDIKHAKKMEDIAWKQWNWIQVFLQIKLDESKPGGIHIEKIPEFLELIGDMENVSLIWFSAIGKSECSDEERREEFQTLKDLRNKYLPNGFISAGTSRDYTIALEMWVDIIRIGKWLYE